MTLKVRPVRPEEVDLFAEFEGDAFVITPERLKEFIDRDVRPNPAEITRALVDEKDQLKVVLELFLTKIWFGPQAVPMLGIAGVASPPENRRKGYIKELFRQVWQEHLDKGYAISTLYPFYFPFYKNFGYEQASVTKVVKMEVKQLAKFKAQSGEWRKATAEQWEDFRSIYNDFRHGGFGHLDREKRQWEHHFDPFRGRGILPKAFLWYNEAGQPEAYIIYRFNQIEPEYREMIVRDMGWRNLTARNELFAFLANHDSQTEKFIWHTRKDLELFALLDDPRKCEEKLEPQYMLRLLDVRRALQERWWPNEPQGSFTISVSDEILAHNNIAIQVSFSNGTVHTELLASPENAKLRCHVRQLAQLYAGYLSPFQLRDSGLLQVESSPDGEKELQAAQSLFAPPYQRASHMSDFF